MSTNSSLTSDLDTFTSEALRGQRLTAFTATLSRLLILAIPAKPLRKLLYVAEACLMLDQSQLTKTGIDPTEVETVNIVASAFLGKQGYTQYAIKNNYDNRPNIIRLCDIPFPFSFSQENFERFLDPWLVWESGYYATEPFRVLVDLIKAEGYTEDRAQWTLIKEFLTPQGAVVLQGQFIAWALPKVMRWMAKLTHLIQASDFYDALKVQDAHDGSDAYP